MFLSPEARAQIQSRVAGAAPAAAPMQRPAGVKPGVGAAQMPKPMVGQPPMTAQPVAPDKRAIMLAAMRAGK